MASAVDGDGGTGGHGTAQLPGVLLAHPKARALQPATPAIPTASDSLWDNTFCELRRGMVGVVKACPLMRSRLLGLGGPVNRAWGVGEDVRQGAGAEALGVMLGASLCLRRADATRDGFRAPPHSMPATSIGLWIGVGT